MEWPSVLAGGSGSGPAGADPVAVADRAEGLEGQPAIQRRYGRIAAVLFIAGALSSIPSTLLYEPPLPPTVYLLTALAIVSGLGCLAFPWERVAFGWFHLVAIVATVEVSAMIAVAGIEYASYYTFVAVFAAYIFTSRAAVISHLAFISAAFLGAVLYAPGPAREALIVALVGIPALAVIAGTVAYLGERVEDKEETYRRLLGRDPLTGVGNYRSLREYLAQEIARHGRYGRQFAVIMVDLDDFKRFNESLGHLGGDHVLRTVGQALATNMRTHDIVTRQGGDEFSIIAPETGSRGAEGLAKRIEGALGGIDVDDGPLTASTGWAVYPQGGATPDELLGHADDALRTRKHARHTAAPA